MDKILVIINSLIAISAIVIPYLTSKSNNKTQIQLKQIELFDTRKANIISDYLSSLNNASKDSEEYNRCFSNAYPYVSEKSRVAMENFNNKLYENIIVIGCENIHSDKLDIYKALSEDLQNLTISKK